ncbi:MAG: hypothetical protein KAX36_02875 [Thermoflexales bacterium]|nr:hypothetical protein [Thermoflexales bacterium]
MKRRQTPASAGFWWAILGGLALVAVVATVAVLTANDAADRSGAAGPAGSGSAGGGSHPSRVIVAAVPRPGASGRVGYDPLSSAERDLALKVALSDERVAKAASGAKRSETIVVERHEETKAVYAKGAWDRRADVVFYLYGPDLAVSAVVNLTTRAADVVDARANYQPPLTRSEMNRAFDLAMADVTASAKIRSAYQNRIGRTLADPEAIERYGFVFMPDEVPEATSPDVLACGLRRCALMVLAVAGDVLDTTIVVDLSNDRAIFVGGEK